MCNVTPGDRYSVSAWRDWLMLTDFPMHKLLVENCHTADLWIGRFSVLQRVWTTTEYITDRSFWFRLPPPTQEVGQRQDEKWGVTQYISSCVGAITCHLHSIKHVSSHCRLCQSLTFRSRSAEWGYSVRTVNQRHAAAYKCHLSLSAICWIVGEKF